MEENQIQRYGRQILLREVGGKGQRKLLSRGVHVRDLSEISSVAVEFLAAAGSPISLAPGLQLQGFVTGPSLEAFNADAQRPADPYLSLGSTPALAEGAAITVGANPQGLGISPDGATVLVAINAGGPGTTLTPITVASNTPGAPITVGSGAVAVSFVPDQAPVASFTT